MKKTYLRSPETPQGIESKSLLRQECHNKYLSLPSLLSSVICTSHTTRLKSKQGQRLGEMSKTYSFDLLGVI